ncbi:hypothetical protein GCM10023096_30450 [Nonomuraea ferruginea]
MYLESFGGGTRTGSSPAGGSTGPCGAGVGAGEVTAAEPAPDVVAADRTPAIPAGWLQPLTSSAAPADAANRPIRPARMISTVSEDNLYLCSRQGAVP